MFLFQNLEFHGVMRFYFQDSGQKVSTKCIRVPSTATTRHVIETLIEKFRPDMRMLSIPEYTLYEIHENGGQLFYLFDNNYTVFLLFIRTLQSLSELTPIVFDMELTHLGSKAFIT